MKLRQEETSGGVRVWIKGSIDGSKCHCLENFWELNIADDLERIAIEMSEVDEIDPSGIASLVTILRNHLAHGAHVVLTSPPQMLAHTLYKTAMMNASGRLQVDAVRDEEPYAG